MLGSSPFLVLWVLLIVPLFFIFVSCWFLGFLDLSAASGFYLAHALPHCIFTQMMVTFAEYLVPILEDEARCSNFAQAIMTRFQLPRVMLSGLFRWPSPPAWSSANANFTEVTQANLGLFFVKTIKFQDICYIHIGSSTAIPGEGLIPGVTGVVGAAGKGAIAGMVEDATAGEWLIVGVVQGVTTGVVEDAKAGEQVVAGVVECVMTGVVQGVVEGVVKSVKWVMADVVEAVAVGEEI
ncbi:hypothetical protein EV424DRAFT_1351771 [Suillus variegatus]|nr:hypothetical protein EV424DRAFT_1351771 [Suillus variegatus]